MYDVDAADKAGRKRARLMMASAILFVTTQAVSFHGPGTSRPESVRLVAWGVWALLLLLLLAGVGGWRLRPGVRAMLNDELTRENRRAAMVTGFWAAIGMAIFAGILAVLNQVGATEVARMVLTFAIATAVFAFAFAERSAHRDG